MRITWNGRSIPPELRKLPPGEYTVVDDAPPLTPEEEAGIEQALRSLDRGEGIPAGRVFAKIDTRIRKAAAARRKRRKG